MREQMLLRCRQDFDAVTSVCLGGIHGSIGPGDEAFRCVFRNEQGDAEAGGNRFGNRECRLCDVRPQSFGKNGCLCQCGVVQEKDEFFAAEAGNQVFSPAFDLEHLGKRDENLIAGQVSVPVVDGLEPVEIGHDDRKWLI